MGENDICGLERELTRHQIKMIYVKTHVVSLLLTKAMSVLTSNKQELMGPLKH